MTIRINRRDTQHGVVVEPHGWLSEDVVAEFERLCASIQAPLTLDLSQLVGADTAGLRALRCRIAAGARLEGLSPYISLLLAGEDRRADPGADKRGSET